MKIFFSEYFKLTDKQIEEIWLNALYVFDANVLLRLYRFKQETTEDILKVLTAIQGQIWLPYQVGLEYNRNRYLKIGEAEKVFSNIMDKFEKCYRPVADELAKLKEFGIHPQIDLEPKVEKLVEAIRKEHSELKKEYQDRPPTNYFDELHLKIAAIFDGKIGPEPSREYLQQIAKEGAIRYEEGTPPGYRDSHKGQGDKTKSVDQYGDLIIWKQLIDKAKLDRKPVIFITEDAKDDWWLRENNQTIGPRPELRKEFWAQTEKLIHFYRLESFLEFAKTRFKVEIKETSEQEIKRDAQRTINPMLDSSDGFINWVNSRSPMDGFHITNLLRLPRTTNGLLDKSYTVEHLVFFINSQRSLLRNIVNKRSAALLKGIAKEEFQDLNRWESDIRNKITAAESILKAYQDVLQSPLEFKENALSDIE